MIAIKHRQRLWFKAIAIGVVCLLTLNSISWAMPKHTLAAQSRFNLFSTNNGLGLQNNATILYAVNGLKELISSDTLSQGSIARLNKSVGTKFHDTNIAIGTDFEEGELRSKGKREYKLFTFGFQKENIEIETLFLPDHTNLTPEEKDELKERFKVKNDTDRAYLDCPGLEGVWFVNPTTKQSATVRKVKRQQDSIFREGGDELAMAGLSDVALRGRGIVTKADAEGADLELPSEPSPNLDARPGQVVGDKCRTVVTWLRDQSLGLILGLLVADVIATIFLIVKLPNPRTTESQFDRNATKVESDSDIENIGDPAVLVERLRKWDRKIQAAKKLVELAETDPAKTIPILVKNASAGYGECSASSVLVK